MDMAQFTYSQMGNTHWYRVIDAKNNDMEYAVFSLIDAPHARPPSCKHLNIHIPENIWEQIIENRDMALLANIFAFVFQSVLKITHELKGVNLCKIYSHGEKTRAFYQKFTQSLGTAYEVKSYGNWIEILKK